MTVQGYDISALQGDVNFQTLANNGIKFVILRCGIGNDGIDGDYKVNVAHARAAGLQVACYHFIYPLPTVPGKESRSPQAQAQAHFNASEGVLAACDLEWPTSDQWQHWGCSAAEIKQWALEYLQTYSQLSGRNMLLYTYPYFAQSLNLAASPEFAQYPLWIASYEANPAIPAPWNDWVLWQTTGGGGHLPNGAPVDTDVAKDLSLWGVSQTVQDPVQAPDPVQMPDPVQVPDPVQAPAPAGGNIWTSIGNSISQMFKKTK